MIPVGYMAKRVVERPDWLEAFQVSDVCADVREAKPTLEDGKLSGAEPRPYRIFAVYPVDWPEVKNTVIE